MKRAFAPFLLVFLAFATTDAFAVADYLTRELKCPKCKMKIEQRGVCPCCLKKKIPKTSFIHDPCADEDGDLTLHFDRVHAVFTLLAGMSYTATHTTLAAEHLSYSETISDLPSPPPRH